MPYISIYHSIYPSICSSVYQYVCTYVPSMSIYLCLLAYLLLQFLIYLIFVHHRLTGAFLNIGQLLLFFISIIILNTFPKKLSIFFDFFGGFKSASILFFVNSQQFKGQYENRFKKKIKV